MKTTLWGPPLWDLLFAAAWACPAKHSALLWLVLTEHLEEMLPCVTCRAHFRQHLPAVRRRVTSKMRSPADAFRWLYHLKAEVNRSLKRPSISLADFTQRFELRGAVVDEIAVADVLVLVALSAAHRKEDDTFVQMCRALAAVLPFPCDSQVAEQLARMDRPIAQGAAQVARTARIERGHKPLSLAHYKSLAGPL